MNYTNFDLIHYLQKDACKEQQRGNTNIEAVKYFYEKWKQKNSFGTILEAENESRVCLKCLEIWTGSGLVANCSKCKQPTINTGPIGEFE